MRDLHGSEKAIHRLSMEMLHGVSHGFGPSALYSWVGASHSNRHISCTHPAVWACGLPTWQWRGSCIPKAGSGIWRACLFGPGSWRWATLSIIRSARPGAHLSNNIFLTLALGVLMLNILVGSNPATQWGVRPRSAGEWTLRLFGVILVLAASLFSEGGILILPFLLITYLCRERMVLRNVLYFALSAVLFLLVFVPYPTAQETLQMLAFNSDFLFITVLPVLSHYDGTRGPNTKGSKYFFYVFYPLAPLGDWDSRLVVDLNLKIGTAVESIALSTAVRYDKEKKGGIRPCTGSTW